MKRRLHLNLFILGRGHHEASWLHPAASQLSMTDIRHYQDLAQRAEAGLFDSIFMADSLAVGTDIALVYRLTNPRGNLAVWLWVQATPLNRFQRRVAIIPPGAKVPEYFRQ